MTYHTDTSDNTTSDENSPMSVKLKSDTNAEDEA